MKGTEMTTTMTELEFAEIVKAWADGLSIQVTSYADTWIDTPYPDWNFVLIGFRYRVKPDAPPAKGPCAWCGHPFDEHDDGHGCLADHGRVGVIGCECRQYIDPALCPQKPSDEWMDRYAPGKVLVGCGRVIKDADFVSIYPDGTPDHICYGTASVLHRFYHGYRWIVRDKAPKPKRWRAWFPVEVPVGALIRERNKPSTRRIILAPFYPRDRQIAFDNGEWCYPNEQFDNKWRKCGVEE